MASTGLYDLSQLEINDQFILTEVGGKKNWTALSSALETDVSYEIVSEAPLDYMDFKQRYLVTKKVDEKQKRGHGRKRGVAADPSQEKMLLAYCFTVKVFESDFGDSASQIPNAIIEDIIADVELLKGQSTAYGKKF